MGDVSVLSVFNDEFETTLGSIESAKDIKSLQSAVNALIEPYGLSHAVYHAIRIPDVSLHQDVVVFTYPEDWVKTYLSRRYYTFDPVVLASERGILPIDWATLDRSSPAVRKLFGEARDAGIGRHGLTIPIRGATGDHAIFTITSVAVDSEWTALKRSYMRDMQLIGHYVHGRVLDIYGVRKVDYSSRISPREKECLQWAASGKTIEDTATILSLSDRVVRGYLDSARHKLDCLTKTQAVARALQLGIITF